MSTNNLYDEIKELFTEFEDNHSTFSEKDTVGHYEKSTEDRVSELEIENTKMRDRLLELGDEMSEKIRENMKNLRTGKRTGGIESVPLPQGTDYHGDGVYYSKWNKKEEKDNKDV